ncbi:MAG TPA: hypothetical protein VGR45_16570 [Stellaceae bacterium]|nr:hypothetical protein [Stellaceae bacterium]
MVGETARRPGRGREFEVGEPVVVATGEHCRRNGAVSLSNLDKSVSLPDGRLLRAVFGAHAAKKISRVFGISIPTAKVWLDGRLPAARRDEISAVLDIELSVQHQRIVALRQAIAAGRASGGASEKPGSTGAARDSGGAALGRRAGE